MTNPDTGRPGGEAASRVEEDAAKARAALEREATSAREKLSEARRMAEEQARSIVDDAAHQARSYADTQKEMAARSLKDFADAVRNASDELGQRDQSLAARFVREAAGGLESLSQSVNSRSFDGMLDTVRDFARSNPTAFVAGSVLAGVAIGRFARASNEREHRRYQHDFAGSSHSGGHSQPRPGAASRAGPAATGATTHSGAEHRQEK
jgi:F0F1-type ATP synthase membrane subunit b/b'